MNKNTILAFITLASATIVACKSGTSSPGEESTDTIAVENMLKKPGEGENASDPNGLEKQKEFAKYFNSIKLGMTAEEVSKAMATLPEEGFEWEGLKISFDFEECSFDVETNQLTAITYKTDIIGTGEYKFIGDGKQALYENKDGAKSYDELGAMLERFASFVSEALGCNVADCSMQTFSAMGDDWAGSIEMDYYNAPKRTVTENGQEIELSPVFLKFSITTLGNYAG
ncbi:MAG: hypothetical protein KBT39_10940 [Bacteroidales bacterium]|nr:hypothetical protein [Bacteroidales bacterium]